MLPMSFHYGLKLAVLGAGGRTRGSGSLSRVCSPSGYPQHPGYPLPGTGLRAYICLVPFLFRIFFIKVGSVIIIFLFSFSNSGQIAYLAVLRIRIRDPGLGAFLTPGSGIRDGRKSASGSEIRDEQPGFFCFFWG